MKKILISLLVLFLCITGCKNNESPNKEGNQGSTSGGSDLKNVTDKNYEDVAKTTFGMDIKNNKGWTLKSAYSPNKVNNLIIEYTVSDGEDGEKIIKEYFDASASISKDGVYSYAIGEDHITMVKKDKYVDFETYFSAKGTKMQDYNQAMWIYSYGNKNVLFSITVEGTKSNISFTLMS